jgi:hypothetical protein
VDAAARLGLALALLKLGRSMVNRHDHFPNDTAAAKRVPLASQFHASNRRIG